MGRKLENCRRNRFFSDVWTCWPYLPFQPLSPTNYCLFSECDNIEEDECYPTNTIVWRSGGGGAEVILTLQSTVNRDGINNDESTNTAVSIMAQDGREQQVSPLLCCVVVLAVMLIMCIHLLTASTSSSSCTLFLPLFFQLQLILRISDTFISQHHATPNNRSSQQQR